MTVIASVDGHRIPFARATILLIVASAAATTAALAGPIFGLCVVVGALAAYAYAAAPGVLLAAFVATAYYKNAVQPFSPVDITLLLALLNFLQFIPVVLDRRPRRISLAGLGLWTLLAFLVLGAVLWAMDQDLALTGAARWWGLVFLPLLPASIRVGSDVRYIRQFLWTLFCIGVVTVLVGLTALSNTERLAVLGQNTIQVARGALLVPLLAATFVLTEPGRPKRMLALLLVPPALIVALASGSRGPFAALLLVSLAWMIGRLARPQAISWRFARTVGAMAIISGATLLAVSTQLPDAAIQRFVSLGDVVQGELSGDTNASEGDGSVNARITLIRFAGSLFYQHPLLGVGTSGFGALSPRVLGTLESDEYPHNAVVQLAAEYGLVGVAICAGLVLLALTRRLPPTSARTALRALFVFFLLNAMVSGNVMEDRLTWSLVMLLLIMDPLHATLDAADKGGNDLQAN